MATLSACGAQVGDGRRRIACCDQRLAHEQRVITGGREHPGVGPTAYARLGDPDDSARHAWGHTHCPLLVDLEGDQVALVDADEVGTDRDRPCQLGFVVHLDQRVETDRASKRMERLQLGVVERCRDEQHAIGAHQSCIAHVVRGHREVLAQHRPTARGSRRRKIGWDLYNHLGIARGETDKMKAQAAHNLRFFGAPVGMICVIDRKLEIGSWIDYGMFLQNIAIAARARGLDTCHMAIFAQFGENIRRLLNLSESDVVVCGVALGHEDPTSPANRLRTERVPATEFTELRGF